jgi:hypothetical protein
VDANSLTFGTTASAVQQTAGRILVTTTTNVRDDTKLPGADFVGAITLNQSANDFQGAVSLQNSGANNIVIRDTDALDFGASKLGTGTLTINAVGITQSGAITQTGAGLVTITGNGGAISLANPGNNFVGDVTATSTSSISLADLNNLQVAAAGINAGTSLTLSTGAGVTQAGAITANTLIVTAGGTVNLNLLGGGNFGVNQITNLGAVNVAAGDFVLFDQGGGLNLTAGISAAGGVKVVTTGGMAVTGPVFVTAGAPLSAPNQDPGADPHALVLVANHNSTAGLVGGTNNFNVNGGSFNVNVGNNNAVIYVDTQSASTLGAYVPLDFSANTVYLGSAGNVLTLVNGNRGNLRLAIAGPLETNDQAGQLNIDDLFKKLLEMADPARGAGLVTVNKDRRRQLSAQMAAFKQSRSKGVISPFGFGPLQFLGYDFQDLMDAGYGTPAYDPTKVGNETPKSILDGLPLTNNR